MKKNYFKIIFALVLFCFVPKNTNAQCTTPSPPAVSGGTIAGCVSSASFTLTGSATGTNLIGWYANSFGGNALSTNSVFTTPTLTTGTTYYVGQSGSVSATVDPLAMPTFSRNVPAQETRGYYFTAPVDFIITGLRVPVAVGGTISGIAVVKFPVAPPLYTNVTNTFSTLYLNQAIVGTSIVPVNIPVYTGDIIGVLGERNDTSAYGPNLGTGVFPSTIGVSGPTVNLNRMGMLYNLATQTPTNLWTETVNTIGVIEMYVQRACNSTLTPVTVSVVGSPTVVVAPPPVICANSAYTLSASGASTFTWTGGPQSSTYVVNPSTTTTYSVRGSILSTCNSSLSTVTISVNVGVPTLTASSSSSAICSGNSVTLNGSGAPTYTWAGGVNNVTNNSAFFPLATQQYSLYGTNACGTGSTMITVSVNPTPTLITSITPTIVCDGKTATLSVTGAATYSWAGATGPGSTFVITPSVSSVFNVSGISSAGCPANASQLIIVNPSPTVSASASNLLVCSGGISALTAFGALSYSWNGVPGGPSLFVYPLTTTIYTLTGSISNGCASSGTVTVNVFLPTISVSANTVICKGAAVNLNAGAATSYAWSEGLPGQQNVLVSPNSTTIYSVTGFVSNLNGLICPATNTVQVIVNPNPTITAVSSRTNNNICKGESVSLTASGAGSSGTYTWSAGVSSVNAASTTATPINLTTYTVRGTDNNGCSGSAQISIIVLNCVGIETQVSNGSGISVYPNPANDFLTIRSDVAADMTIVNELGQSVQSLKLEVANNYQVSVTGLSSGVYFITSIKNNVMFTQKIIIMK
jgi:hypothetical protein